MSVEIEMFPDESRSQSSFIQIVGEVTLCSLMEFEENSEGFLIPCF